MKLIVGLGNIGDTYQHTYHNIGFDFLDFTTAKAVFKIKKQFLGEIYQQGDILYLKPHTYMNDSGKAVLVVKQYYDIDDNDIVIIHDDSDIVLGQYKIQANRGSGGHHGIDSIFNHISQEVKRIRIGIRAERFIGKKAQDFVLRPIHSEDQIILNEVYQQVQQELKILEIVDLS
jgi:PTH1 family peptidyl-tRNA hydrolase